jgi:serine-type D-Ala-D-Ala carboxypeptidase
MRDRGLPLKRGEDSPAAALCLPPLDTDNFLRSLDRLFSRAITTRTFSGAALLVARPDLILFHRTWGKTHDGGSAIDRHTLFDLASLTKPLITAALCMRAVAEGEFGLDDPLRSFFPSAMTGRATGAVTIRQLLSHSSGLPAYEPFYGELIALEATRRREVLLGKILYSPLLSRPGTASCYSDLGFMLLAMILEDVYGTPLDRLAALSLFQGLDGTLRFCRLDVATDPTARPERGDALRGTFAATECCPWRKRLLVGEVHDENAYSLEGVAGHAGLFGTAIGIFRLLSDLWSAYRGLTKDPSWTTDAVRQFWTKDSSVPDSTWMLGFDTPSPTDSSAGSHFSPHSAGHLGFTGTSFWLDMEREILIILLANRVYPTRENERMKSFRPLVHNLVMETCLGNSSCQ